ncbi:discoidin domain-containing protein, partial [Opitutales bacterium]|nr:discoidin domain-containing protein [Opitutales bacterium]
MKISRLLFLSLLTLWTRVLFADANTTISAAEYFVDTDPGEGSGTALSAQDGAFDSEVEAIAPVDFNVTGLSVGPHLIGIRYKDNNNTWGEVLYQTIHVYDANPSGSGSGGSGGGGSGGASGGFASISAAEYFVDTDPGAGSGIAFQAKDGAFDSEIESILPKDLNVTGLSVGPHLVGVRYKDNNNTWGEVLYQTIHVYDANPSGSGSGGADERVWPPADGTVQRSSQGETSTWTVSGASYGNGTYTASSSKSLQGDSVHNAFDGIHDVGSWHTSQNNRTGVLTVQMPEGFIISKYEIYRRVFSSFSTHDDSLSPKNWTFEGSNDGTNWTTLDTQINQTFASGVMGEASKKSYSITNNSTAYSYFRINVTANGGGSYLIIGELKLYESSPVNASGGFASISAAEYFVDTDPGAGSGIAFQAKDGAFDSEVESILPKDLNVTGLSVGP